MTARKPRVGEVWTTRDGGASFRVVLDVPDCFGRIVVADRGGNYYTLIANTLRPPKLTLDDLPPIPEYWVNVYPDGDWYPPNVIQCVDPSAGGRRIARVRLVPDPDSIVECSGREVLG